MDNQSDFLANMCLGPLKKKNKKENVPRHLPVGTGPYSVGSLDYMCDPNSENNTFFRLYYPIEKTDIYSRCKQWPLWIPRKDYFEGYAHFLGVNNTACRKFFKWIGGDIYLPVLWQSPPSPCLKKFPILVFSHGMGGNRTSNSVFCLEMASRGYIVAALEHRDGTASMTFKLKDPLNENLNVVENETSAEEKKFHETLHRTHSFHSYTEEWKPFEFFEPWDDYQYRNKQVKYRCDEVSRALNILLALNDGIEVHNTYGGNFNNKLFKGRMDPSKIVISGHSFGGSTTLYTLAKDKRFKLGLVLDGWMHPLDKEMYDNIPQPCLMVNMETFQWKENIEKMQKLMKDDNTKTMITIKGTCHKSVTDFQFTCNTAVGFLIDLRHTLSPKKVMDVNNKACLGFMSTHLDIPGCGHEDILTGTHRHVIPGTNVDMS